MDQKKVVALEDRLPQLKQERRRKANRRFAVYATLFFLLVLVVVYVQSPLSKVRSIKVYGAQIATDEQVIAASGVTNNTHIWDIRSGNVARAVKRLPSVRSASMTKQFPNEIRITVSEYPRRAYLEKNGSYYPILENGAMLKKLADGKYPVDAPVLVGFSKKEALKAVAGGLATLSRQMTHNISDIHYIANAKNGDDLILYMNDGNRIVASTRTFAQNIGLYSEIAANIPKGKRGTVHLSLGSYFVPYN